MRNIFEKPIMVTVSYLLLMIVMGGRTALYWSHFDTLLPIGDLTIFSIVFACALALTVPASSYYRSKSAKGTGTHRTATFVMSGAAITDGVFNVSEAILLLVGLAPTLLTIGLASLAGSLTAKQERKQSRTQTKIAVAIERTSTVNDTFERHLTTIRRQLTTGDTFSRAQVEQWTSLGKGQAVNIVNYGVDRGLFTKAGRGVYVYEEHTDD
jgi:hypothetical protein